MVEVYFLARHTPFWSVPLMILGAEFAYLFWLRKKKQSAISFFCIALIGFFATSFYMWAGGPEKSVKVLKKMHRNFKDH